MPPSIGRTMADIFLSYARKDKDRAHGLALALAAAGWTVFWDRSIPAGGDWETHIERELVSCRCVVVLWSSAALSSIWVRNEAMVASQRGILMPALLDDVKLPVAYMHLQAAQLQQWRPGTSADDGFVHLVEGIESLASRTPAAPPVKKPRARAVPQTVVIALPPRVFLADAWSLPDEPLLGFVEIPAGPFKMGSRKKAGSLADEHESPQHDVHLPAFYIGRYPVTVAQFKAWLVDRGQDARSERLRKFLKKAPDDNPVTEVSWSNAMGYSAWLEAKLKAWSRTPASLADALAGRRPGASWHVTLPSEAEWEKAARGVDGRVYPWGNNTVGSFNLGSSPYGVLNMVGGVRNWTRSWYRRYPYRPDDEREKLDARPSGERVVRGGNFPYIARVAYRHALDCVDTSRYPDVGFRTVITRLLA